MLRVYMISEKSELRQNSFYFYLKLVSGLQLYFCTSFTSPQKQRRYINISSVSDICWLEVVKKLIKKLAMAAELTFFPGEYYSGVV